MNIYMTALPPDERARLREAEMKRERDERERRIAAQVTRVEAEVRALRNLVDRDKDGDGRIGDAR